MRSKIDPEIHATAPSLDPHMETGHDSILKLRLTTTHMALVRGWVQGLELSELAERYLAGTGDDDGCVDLRVAKSALTRVLDELAAIARHTGIAGGVTLKRQASRIRTNPNAPSLEDFANQMGGDADFYNEQELIELYKEAHGKDLAAIQRRSRLVSRQLTLITDLSHHLTSPMSLGDLANTWFEESLSQRLADAGLRTIEELAIAIVRNPSEWHQPCRGIGEMKANRIVRFLSAQLGPLDDVLARAGIPVLQAIAAPSPLSPFVLALDGVAPPSPLPASDSQWELTQDAPNPVALEVNPFASVDGSHGRLRGDPNKAATKAVTDKDALETWLSLKDSDLTKALYRREIERLMMWCVMTKQIALSSLAVEDASEYTEFLANVPENWIAKKGTSRGDVEWRPFAGSLSKRSIGKALVIINNFFNWMLASNYVTANPFAIVKVKAALPSSVRRTRDASDTESLKYTRKLSETVRQRTLSHAAKEAVERELAESPRDQFSIRARFIYHFAIYGGLRMAEIASARRDDLYRIERTATDPGGWMLRVVGKFNKFRTVPLPEELIEELSDYLESRGLPRNIREVEPGVFLVGVSPSHLVRTKKNHETERHKMPGDGITAFAIHRALRQLFTRAIARVAQEDAEAAIRLEQASAHWLRHTYGTDAIAHEVPLEILRDNLGHSNISTTNLYVNPDDTRRSTETRKYWDASFADKRAKSSTG